MKRERLAVVLIEWRSEINENTKKENRKTNARVLVKLSCLYDRYETRPHHRKQANKAAPLSSVDRPKVNRAKKRETNIRQVLVFISN